MIINIPIFKNILKIFVFLIFSCYQTVFANEFSMERIDYTENYNEQISLDEELFEKDIYSSSDYDDYNVFTYNETENSENEICLIVSPKKESKPSTVLKATVEKIYKPESITAFNTFWDNSPNFRTVFNTGGYMRNSVASVIQDSYYRFDAGDNTKIDWGHTALSSHNDINVGFIDRLESDYDSGMKFSSDSGNINFSGALYQSLETQNASGGIVFSTNNLILKNNYGSVVFGGGIYGRDYTDGHPINTAGLFTKFSRKNFSLGLQFSGNSYYDRGEKFGTGLFFYPEYKISRSLTLSGGISGFFGENYSKEEFGIKYKPFNNNPNDFSVSLKTIFYNGEGIKNKQRIKINTEFKI